MSDKINRIPDERVMLPSSLQNNLTSNALLNFLLSISLPNASRFHRLERCLVATTRSDPSWADVHAISVVYDSSEGPEQGFQLVSEYAVKVFNNQPTRRFLRGFHVAVPSSVAEFRVFDRGGSFVLESFGIHEEPSHFEKTMVSLLNMSNDALGMDTFIRLDELGRYVVSDEHNRSQQHRIYIERIYMRPGIVAQGTVACFRGRRRDSERWELAVKFLWRPEKERPEQEVLAILKERNVWGVVQLRGYRDIDSLVNIRNSLGYDMSQGRLEDMILSCIIITPYGRSLWDFSTISELLVTVRDAIKAHKSLYQQGKMLHQDISPNNIIIIIITEVDNEDDPRGALIDLDLAMNVEVGPRREGEVVGSKPFMSIGVLQRKIHTYRRGLESFLYMLLWLAVSDSKRSPPTTSKLQEWFKGSFSELAEKKIRHMEKGQFGEIIAEFAPKFQDLRGLAEELRQILFSAVESSLFTETDVSLEGTEKLYHSVIGAFEKAIQHTDRPSTVSETITDPDEYLLIKPKILD